MVIFLPETYHPKLIRNKAERLNICVPRQPISEIYKTTLTRPWIMLWTEPILFALSLYMAFVYGILYLDFTAYPFVFEDTRHWAAGIAGLSFLGMQSYATRLVYMLTCLEGIGIGMAIATASSPYINRVHGHYVKKLGGPRPEARLPHLIILAWLIPVGLFWFAWTSSPSVHWAVCIVAGIPFGIGFVTLFLGITTYLIDCYGKYAASALAANAVLRSLFGAGFPLFSRQMYEQLGTAWATSLLGFLAAAMAPLTFVFYRYGPWLRSRSKFHLATVDSGKPGGQ